MRPATSHALKAALLSGLVFPGLGQALLRHYGRAAALLAAFSALFIALLVKVMQRAAAIMESLQWEGGFIDVGMISEAAVRASDPSDDRSIQLLLGLLASCWLLGIADAALLGRRKDRQERSI